MCEDDWNCTSGVTSGFLEEFGGDGRISMEASASSQMQVTATPSPSEGEIPPAPVVACGMVRRARGEKGKQGRRGAPAVAGDFPMPPLFSFPQRASHHSAGERSERRNLLRRMLPDTSLSNMNLPICQRTLKPSRDRFRWQRYIKQNPEIKKES